jgi:hypothetical protein
MTQFTSICRSLFAVSLLFAACVTQAQDAGPYEKFNDPFRIYLGGFYADVDSEISINGSIVNPPPIPVEDLLGIEDSKAVAWGGASWHISNRNSLEFEYFQLNRDGAIDLIQGNPIQVGNFLIEAGGINTSFDVSVARLTYGFSLIRSERADLQLKAGLHLADMSVALQLSGAICDAALGETSPCPVSSTGTADEDVTAPLPHFGASFSYAITHNISANLNLIGFAIELDSLDGSLVELDADLAWHPWRHFGVGAGLRYFDADVESKGSKLNGKFEFQYFGPVIYVATTF